MRAAPLDDAGRARLREIHESSIRELEDGLAPELREELERSMLCPRTDPELAALDELVFVLHAVTTGMPVLPDGLVPAVRYGLVHPRKEQRVALTPRGVRVLAIARGEVAAGMD